MATPIITHTFVSAKAASTDATRIDGPKWNDDHVVTGLENVDNTSDVNKPVSTAQAAADAAVASAASSALTTGLAGKVTGPASVTDDLPAIFDGTTGKLVKSKTYAAFKTLLALVKGDVGLGSVDNTSDAGKPVSTAQAAADAVVAANAANATNLTSGTVAAGRLPTFTQTGTGAVARTILGKIGEFFSVKDFGAVGDNSTDDTTAIQAAITAAQVTGGTVYFPPGTYKISSALTISSIAVSLVGSGRLSTVIRTTSATANILTITASYIRVDSLGLVGTTGTVATAGIAIAASNAQGCSFTNLYISDVFSGIQLSASTSCFVQFVKFVNIYGGYGLNTTNGGGAIIVDNQFDPVFYGNYTMSSGFGAWATSTAYALNDVRSANSGFFVCSQAGTSSGVAGGPPITAFNTTIVDGTVHWLFIGATNSRGIFINATSNSNFITNNDISGPWTVGVQITSGDGNSIIGNTIGQIIGTGVTLGAVSTNTLVQGNVISGMYGAFAIAVSDGNAGGGGSRIVDNFVNGTGWYGILIASSNINVEGNFIQGHGQLTGAWAIGVSAGATKFNIVNNTIAPGSSGEITVQAGASDNYNIIGNQIGSGSVTDFGTGMNKVVAPARGVGYLSGSGGTVTQATSKATGVTLSKFSGAITMNAAALAAGTIVSFVLTNTTIAATDVLILNHISGGTVGSYLLNAQCAAGSATINVRNETAGSLSEAIVIQFVVVKAANT